MRSYSTRMINAKEVERKWLHINAKDYVLGRLATKIANVLRGKHKPGFTPHVDCGDYVVVTNVEKIKLTGNKLTDKFYYHATGAVDGLKEISARRMLEEKPERLLYFAVSKMLPRNKLRKEFITKLKIYKGENHPHQAQKIEPLNFEHFNAKEE